MYEITNLWYELTVSSREGDRVVAATNGQDGGQVAHH